MRYIVLLSGGLDSAVNLAVASGRGSVVCALFFDYGQKAGTREREAAEALAKHYGCELRRVELPWYSEIARSALVAQDIEIPDAAAAPDALPDEAGAVWVPNRNCVFVAAGAAFAEALGADAVVAGFNREEGAAFPDNSAEFRDAMDKALSHSTLAKVRLVSFTQEMTKSEIVREGRKLDLPFDLIWSCYRGGEEPCGKCESCARYRRAIEEE